MKICQTHWDLLRARITVLGLHHLVVGSTEEMTAIVKRALGEGYHAINDFDPLLMANFAIWRNALAVYGANYMMTLTEDRQARCPLCEHVLHDGDPQAWIDSTSDEALAEARKLGLVPSLQ